MIDLEQLEEMRADTLDSLPELGWILRETTIEDGAGGLDVAWNRTTVASMPIRVAPVSSNARSMFYAIADKPLIEPTHMLTLKQGVDIVATDRIEMSTGKLFIVVNLVNPRSFQVFTRVLCKELS